MNFLNRIRLVVVMGVLLTSCASKNNSQSSDVPGKDEKSFNYLSMKINGQDWKADNEILGAFHPKGYDNAIIMAGSKGPKGKQEQAFNINLYKTNGSGVFQIQNGNTAKSVIQLANLSEQNYLYGSMLGFNVKINIIKATANPTEIEATFEGELTGNAGDKLVITEGKFYYHE